MTSMAFILLQNLHLSGRRRIRLRSPARGPNVCTQFLRCTARGLQRHSILLPITTQRSAIYGSAACKEEHKNTCQAPCVAHMERRMTPSARLFRHVFSPVTAICPIANVAGATFPCAKPTRRDVKGEGVMSLISLNKQEKKDVRIQKMCAYLSLRAESS